MSKTPPVRRLNNDDLLYRKLNPDDWDRETLEVADEAFVDGHAAQSFFLAREKTPQEVLASFARFKAVKKLCGKERPTAKDLYKSGYGIAVVRVSDLRARGFSIEQDSSGNEFNEAGHVDVPGLKEKPHLISDKARALVEEEIFPGSDEG
jgi:hypothetical protein